MLQAYLTDRRIGRRVRAIAAHEPCPRQQAVLFRTRADVEARAALTDEQREALDAHLARVIAGER